MRDFKFAEILKKLLTEKKISGADLGRKIGVSKETISQYCKGYIIPKADKLVKIAEYFDVSPEFLFTGIEPQDKKEQQNLNLSSATIRLLKTCKPEILTLIDTFLSDSEFYSTLSNALDSMNFYGDYLFGIFAKNNITLSSTTQINDSDRQPIGIPRAIRKYENIYDTALENASFICKQEIGSYFSDVLSENSEMKKARDFFYGKFE